MIGQYCGPVCGAPLDWVPMSVVAESDGLDFDSNPFVYGISGNIRGRVELESHHQLANVFSVGIGIFRYGSIGDSWRPLFG